MRPQLSTQTGFVSRRVAAVVLAVALTGGAAVGAMAYFDEKDKPAVSTAEVTIGSVEKTVTSLGKLKPKDYVDVGTQVSGQLRRVHVNIGDRVAKGDLIAEIDPTVYETRVRNDRANLDNLRAQLVQLDAEAALAKLQFQRNRDLMKERAISEETVEQNEATLKVSQARVQATRAQIKAAQATLDGDVANLGYTKIHAPVTGTVVSQTTLQGQTVNANQQAPVIVRVADLDTMTVWAQVAEADVVKIRPGMPAYFITLGNGDKRWEGRVRQVMPTPEIVNDVVLYNVLVDVDNREQSLMIDMTVQVFFLMDQAKQVPVVPVAALKPSPGKAPSHFRAEVVTGSGIEMRDVTIGVTNRTTAQIIAGLSPGDKVIVPGADKQIPEKRPGAPGTGGLRGGPRL